MEYNEFVAMIMLALLFSVIGMFYCIYVDAVTNFLLFCVLFTIICLFSVLYSQLEEIKDSITKRGGKK